jgi:hypothetical protein
VFRGLAPLWDAASAGGIDIICGGYVSNEEHGGDCGGDRDVEEWDDDEGEEGLDEPSHDTGDGTDQACGLGATTLSKSQLWLVQ